MDNRVPRIASFIFAGLVLLFLAVACLVPLSFPSDPAAGREQTFYNFQLAAMIFSTLFGSAGMMMFIRAAYVLAGKGIASRRSVATVGLLVVCLAIFLMAISMGHRSAMSPWLFLLGILIWYGGGGFLLLAVTRLPRPADELEP